MAGMSLELHSYWYTTFENSGEFIQVPSAMVTR